jgi:CcmD family protein
MRSFLASFVLGLALYFGSPLTAAGAQEESGDRAASFKAVSGASSEDVPGGPLVVIAYGLIWVVVFGYVFRLVRLHKNVDENLARLQQDVSKAARRGETPK